MGAAEEVAVEVVLDVEHPEVVEGVEVDLEAAEEVAADSVVVEEVEDSVVVAVEEEEEEEDLEEAAEDSGEEASKTKLRGLPCPSESKRRDGFFIGKHLFASYKLVHFSWNSFIKRLSPNRQINLFYA